MPPKNKSRAEEAKRRRRHHRNRMAILHAARIHDPHADSSSDDDRVCLATTRTYERDIDTGGMGDGPSTSGRFMAGRRLLYGHPDDVPQLSEPGTPNDASFSEMSIHSDVATDLNRRDAETAPIMVNPEDANTDSSLANRDPRTTSDESNAVPSDEEDEAQARFPPATSSSSSQPDIESADEAAATTVQEDIGRFVSKHSLTCSSTKELLSIFHKAGVGGIPRDRRTLLKTPRAVPGVVDLAGGSFKYFGLKIGLVECLKQHPNVARLQQNLHIAVSIDGLPLHKSSKSQFWPILCKIQHAQPFIVGLFHGNTKPTNIDEYLAEFLQEYEDLRDNGMEFEGQIYNVHLMCWVCDAPARCFLKAIKGHTGYYACERCKVKGFYEERKVLYPVDVVYEKRTDAAFANMQYHNGEAGDEHQNGHPSPLIAAGINCVSSVVIDPMHCVYLGVWKRFLQFLFTGPRHVCRLSNAQKNQLHMKLLSLRLPREFCRQPRTLFQMEYWKATEYRSSLLYTGLVFLRGVVSHDIYGLYLKLAVAMNILHTENDDRRNAYLDYARQLLVEFIRDSSILLGRSFVVYNVHSLSHIPDDVQNFQCSLNDISAFAFENHLQSIKKLVKSTKNPIGQVYSRLSERQHQNLFQEQKAIPHIISTHKADSMFFLNNTEEFAMIQRRRRRDGRYDVLVFSAAISHDYFVDPCESKRVGIFLVRNLDRVDARPMVMTAADLTHKVVVMPLENGRDYVLVPMLHDT